MDDRRLLAILEAERRRAVGQPGGELSQHRIDAWNAYMGKPDSGRLTVIEDRSQAVLTKLRDTIEWIMPDLMRLFAGQEKYCTLDPVGPEDEEAADQETDAINYVIMKENNGFEIYDSWFRDALLMRRGVVTYWWDEVGETTTERYRGLNQMELAALEQSDEVEIISKRKREDPDFAGMAKMAQSEDGVDLRKMYAEQGQEIPVVWDVKVRRLLTGPRLRIEPVPPDEFGINPRAKSIKDAKYVHIRTLVTASDLIEDGISKDVVERLPSYEGDDYYSDERTNRYDDDEEDYTDSGHSMDPSMRRIWKTRAWIRIDYDGDGVAELRYVCWAGQEILENEPVEAINVACIPGVIRIPHRATGLSMYDVLGDLQDIQSQLWRGLLDAVYFALNPQTEVPDDAVNEYTYSDLLTPRIGGMVRTRGVGGMLKPIERAPIIGDAYKLVEYAEGVGEDRTGVTKYNKGTDAPSLNDTASGINMIQQAANARKYLIARSFAETGVKDLMLGIHRMLRQHADEARKRSIRLRGKWVPIDPSEWKHRMDLTVQVGAEDKNMLQAAFTQIGAFMKEIIGLQGGVLGPFIYPQHVHNWFEDLVDAFGRRLASRYIANPMEPPPEVSPEVMQRLQRPDPNAARDKNERTKMLLGHTLELRKLGVQNANDQAQLTMDTLEAIERVANPPPPPQGAGQGPPME